MLARQARAKVVNCLTRRLSKALGFATLRAEASRRGRRLRRSNSRGPTISRLQALVATVQLPPERRTLKQSVVISSALSSGAFAVQLVARIASTIVLTRLLSPEAFGVFAVVLSIHYLLFMFSDLGIRSLILTREGEVDALFLRCCWTVQILRGAAVAAAVLAAAAGIALLQRAGVFAADSSYAAPELPPVVAVTALGFLIGAFEFPNKYLQERAMRFGRVVLAELVVALGSIVLVIGLAVYLRSVSALAAGYVATAALQLGLSAVLFGGPRMRLAWQREAVAVILARGKWIVGHSALSAVTNMADRILLGLYMPAAAFGFYHIARQIIDLPTALLGRVHAQIGLQVFTELHKQRDAFRAKYYRYRAVFDTVTMLSCGGLLTFAPRLVAIVYDDRYAGVATIIQILALGLPIAGFAVLREAFSAERRFREMTLLSLVEAATVWVGLMVALIGFGSVTGALIVVVLRRLPEIVVLLVKGDREGWVDPLREVRFLPLIAIGAGLGWAADRLAGAVLD